MSGDDLDFTKPAPTPPRPAPEKVAQAKREASESQPQLAKTGFYVAMARHAAAKAAPNGGQRYDIFVIEDDPALAALVGEILGKAGFTTRFAATRKEINQEFNRPPLPDLVLLDVALPDADGFSILGKMRGNSRLGKMPVIMMTGKSEATDIARGLEMGADGYVTKPFKVSGLIAAINTVLGLD